MFIYIHILSYYKLFLYINLSLSVKLDSLSCSFTSISFLTYYDKRQIIGQSRKNDNTDEQNKNKDTTQYELGTTMRTQAQIT
jgi:hypothetical protein